MSEKEKLAALIVDDDGIFRERLRRAFELRGWEAHIAATGNEARDIARETGPDLAIVDLRMEGSPACSS
jgi:two-component system response regulator RegA